MEKSFYDQAVEDDFLSKWQPNIASGNYFLGADGHIYSTEECQSVIKASSVRPWVYVNNPPKSYHCTWYHDIAKTFKFIPTHCLNCWKVVVRPRTLVELILLLKVQEEMAQENKDCWCKCGTELRPYVRGNYGGYFYTRSMKVGLKRYREVRERVDKTISPECPVILKRYCSEFEMDFGPSIAYKQHEFAARIEEQIEEYCVMKNFDYPQSKLAKIKIYTEWVKFAYGIDDPSVDACTGGNPIVPPVCTYHNIEVKNAEGNEGRESIQGVFEDGKV